MSYYDEALERFHLSDLEYGDALASHGPLAAEALESLGHPALIPGLVDLHAPRLPPARPGRPLALAERVPARGDGERRGDWVATYEALLAEGPWQDVLRASLPELLPGLFASAGHGLLRTAHAVRALSREDLPIRRRELARGLALWAARWRPVPGATRSACGASRDVAPARRVRRTDPRSIAALWAGVRRLDRPAWRDEPFHRAASRLEAEPAVLEAVARFESGSGFADVAPRGPVAAPRESVAAIVHSGASLYRANPGARIAFVHAVTWPDALATLTPWVDAPAWADAVRDGLLAVAALVAIHGGDDPPPAPSPEIRKVAGSWPEMRYRAACSLQEHAIKLVAACWRACGRPADDALGAGAALEATAGMHDTDASDGGAAAPGSTSGELELRLAAADAALALEGEHGGGRF